MNKPSIKEHTKKIKNITFLDAKWPPKSGTLLHDWFISFVPMLNLHRHVQLACNPETVEINFHFNTTDVCISMKIHMSMFAK